MPKDPLEKRRLIEVERSRLNPLFQFRKTGALLDVGFGSGFFMAQAQESGWTVAGTEITERCVHYGRDELGLQVYQGDIAELNIPRKFDVVSFHHVLEHVPNPIAQVQASKALLRDDGLLYISVPNHLGFDSWRQKSKWNGWALPWHFCHYTPATLQRMLEWRDLRVLSIDFSRSEDFDKPWIARLRGRLPTNWQRRIFSGTEMSIIACKKIAGHTSGD
jgi:SAM-dependent methyltransferase